MALKRRLAYLFPLMMLVAAVALYLSHPPILKKMQFAVFDGYMALKPRPYEELPVKIIDIDDASLRKIGQWPWPRNKLAELVTRLQQAEAAAISFDVLFAEPDRTSPSNILPLWGQEALLKDSRFQKIEDHDQMFAEAIKGANVVTGFVLTDGVGEMPTKKFGYSYTGDDPAAFLDGYVGSVNSLSPLEEAATGNGALNAVPEMDGIIRRLNIGFRLGNSMYPGLMGETLRIAQGASGYLLKTTQASGESAGQDGYGIVSAKIGDYVIPTEPNGKFWVYFTEYEPSRYIPAWKIFSDDFDPELVKGQILFIGTSAQGLRDIRATPLNPTTNGVEVHVQAMEQVLLGKFLERPDYIQEIELAGIIITALVLIIVISTFSAGWGAVVMLLAIGGSVYGSWLAFTEQGLLIDPVTPGVTVLLIYMSESLRRFIMSEREKKHIRSAFSHYMSPALVERLAANPDALKLGGEMRTMTILFCDIRGFTTISEQYNAEELTRFINRFLTPMTDVILSHSGTIDKYMGDAIMAFWNAPLDDEAHAANACRAALHMMSRLREVNIEREAESKEKNVLFLPIHIGIGLNTGEVCVGNMGSDQRFDYSVLGDDVNLASRLEGQSKTYGVHIVLGDKTVQHVPDMAIIELDLIKVKGKTEAVRIHALLGDAALAINPAFLTFKGTYQEMLTTYRAQDWHKARGLLDKCETLSAQTPCEKLDGLFDLYRERIREYEKTPPQQDWDGVYVAMSK